jgi:putative transposase
VLGRGIAVGHRQVELPMRRAGLAGLPARQRHRGPSGAAVVADLVDRNFAVDGPDALWITDITEHPHPRGQGVLLRGAGCLLASRGRLAIDSTQTAALVTNALGMALQNRAPEPGTILHSDQRHPWRMSPLSTRMNEPVGREGARGSGGSRPGAAHLPGRGDGRRRSRSLAPDHGAAPPTLALTNPIE